MIKVRFTNSPQSIEAITAVKDFDIPVNKKKEAVTESISVTKKFFNKKTFTPEGK
jgi:hypothetical protein